MARNSFLNDTYFNIARGKINKASHINKFGYNETVGTSYVPITDLGTNVLPSSAGALTLVSDSTADTSAGTGARTVEVEGLDGDYNSLTETFTLNGVTNVVGSESFLRVFRMKVVTAGTGQVNTGNITGSIGGSDVAQITATQGQTAMAVYTIPANKTGYFIKFHGSLSKNQEANFQLRTKDGNNNVWTRIGLFGVFSESVDFVYPVPLVFTEKTDIEVSGKAGATSEMGAIFDIVLIDN